MDPQMVQCKGRRCRGKMTSIENFNFNLSTLRKCKTCRDCQQADKDHKEARRAKTIILKEDNDDMEICNGKYCKGVKLKPKAEFIERITKTKFKTCNECRNND